MLGLHRGDQTTAGVGAMEATDAARRIHNVGRYGIVRQTDYRRGLLRVGVQQREDGSDELLSDWLPWAMNSAGPDRMWWAPEVGEVVMIMAPSGELANGLVLPSCLSNQNQDGARPGLLRLRFADHGLIEYDRDDHHLIVDLSELTGDAPPAVIHLQTTACRVTLSDADQLLRLESVGNIEIFAGGEVRIVSGKAVSASSQLVEFPPTTEVLTDNRNSETDEPEEIPGPLEAPRPSPEGSSSFIELNP